MKGYSGLAIVAAVFSVVSNDLRAEDAVSWTGFYVGPTLGATSASTSGLLDITKGNGTFLSATLQGLEAENSQPLQSWSIDAGAESGYSYQIDNVVFGIELNVDNINTKERISRTSPNVGDVAVTHTYSSSIFEQWGATLRPRVGYAIGSFLIEGSGGLALASLDVRQSYTDSNPRIESAESYGVKVGWAAGSALSYALDESWSLKAQYLYTSFGRLHAVGPTYYMGTLNTGNYNQSYNLNTNSLEFSANYRF